MHIILIELLDKSLKVCRKGGMQRGWKDEEREEREEEGGVARGECRLDALCLVHIEGTQDKEHMVVQACSRGKVGILQED